jgi:hypothetical protein
MHLRVRGRTTIVAGYSVPALPDQGALDRAHRAYVPAPLWSLNLSVRGAGLQPCFRADPSFPVVIGAGSHPFPFRTRKLSLFPPMVLRA